MKRAYTRCVNGTNIDLDGLQTVPENSARCTCVWSPYETLVRLPHLYSFWNTYRLSSITCERGHLQPWRAVQYVLYRVDLRVRMCTAAFFVLEIALNARYLVDRELLSPRWWGLKTIFFVNLTTGNRSLKKRQDRIWITAAGWVRNEENGENQNVYTYITLYLNSGVLEAALRVYSGPRG